MDPGYDVAVIGAGPAGISAACYCKRKGLNTIIIYQELGGQINYTSRIFSNISAGHGVKSSTLIKRYKDALDYENVEKLNEKADNIRKDRGFFKIGTENRTISSKSTIVASGRIPKTVDIPFNENLDKSKVCVSYFTDYPYRGLKNSKNVLIVGGGYIGLDVAEKLSDHCKNVYVVEKSGKLGGNKRRQDWVKSRKNVIVLMNSEVKEIYNQKGSPKAEVKRKNSKRNLDVDAIYVSVGTKPNTDFLNVKKLPNGEIIVKDVHDRNNGSMTNRKGIFACGDCVEEPEYGFEALSVGEGMRCAKTVYNYLNEIYSSKTN